MPISPARATAFDILLRVDRDDAFASELLYSRCAKLTTADQALTTELVMGVLRWRSLLDARVAEASSQKLSKLDPEVLTALRMGVYQLGWLDRIPPRAAIHESVELVKRARKRSAAPFANAVLRKLADAGPGNSSHADLISSATDCGTIANQSSHPEWLVRRWISQFGVETARQICAYDQSIPVTAIRLRVPSAEDDLRAEGIALEKGSFLKSARRVVQGNVTRTKALVEARATIQDEASQLVAALVGKGSRILDCCAAPGGKTWAIADRNPDARIVAAELHPHRAELLRERVPSQNVEVVTADIRELPLQDLFDCVLVDAPCSGTGTLARNPEIKWRLKPDDLEDLHARQVAILQSAMQHGAPHGTLIYSTCSLEPEEDEDVVSEALSKNPSFQLGDVRPRLEALRAAGEFLRSDLDTFVRGPYLRTIPGIHPCDGFFVAMLKRTH